MLREGTLSGLAKLLWRSKKLDQEERGEMRVLSTAKDHYTAIGKRLRKGHETEGSLDSTEH